jgi:hypothetical protein
MGAMDGQIAILRQSRGPWEFQRYPLPDPEPQYHPRLLPRALDFVQRTRAHVPWDRVISHTFPLEGIQQAFEQAEWVGREPAEAVITRAAVTP